MFTSLLIPAAQLDDSQLRQELVTTHQVEAAVRDHCLPEQRAVLQARLADLDAEYLRRYPDARAKWPW
ncbi:DUF6158 family protein [Allorhizocola rhizosphaerae]|uniref:DUF6158 family protein n=1 Tax=Allorhizocola rhizosphaerae TaxID=1872709 RepID=UPI0013C2B20D|nr:DUF6158 family protein [Allorhizocola rhizosphaerae]